LQENLALSYVVANTPLVSLSSPNTSLQSLNSIVSILASETFVSTSEQPNITIIGSVVFLYTSKLLSSSKFQLCLCFSDIQANSAQLAETSDLLNVSPKYHKFTDIFSKVKAEVFTLHYFYDLKINLEENAQSSVDLMDSLLASEQETLKKFINKNLNMDFI